MGSKNLKAVVVRGKMKPAVSNPEKFKEIQKLAKVNLEPTGMDGFGKYGTPGVTTPQHKAGGLPTYNFNSGNFDKHEEIDGLKLYNEHLRGKCKRVAQIDEGPFKTDAKYGGPEYETLATFGSYCGISDMDAIIHANALCNMYGMDTISCGATIAWAMECWEEGKITAEDTGGIELQYGNAEAMAKITEMIANREGFGEILAEGSKKAAEIIGRGTEDYLITSKGQEAPAHMPQVKRSLSVIYAANPFGADHESSEHDPGYKAYPERMKEIGLTNPQEKLALNKEMMRFAMITQHLSSAVDSLSVCAFVFGASFQLYSPEELVKTVNAVMGWDVDMKEILEVGERRLNMLRAFNSREGVGRESDTLPKKMFKRPLEGGRSDGYVLDEGEWEVALEDYYRLCDWDVETGHPSLRKMESLGLGWVVAENEALSHAIT